MEAANDPVTHDHRLRRLRFRAWHRGTKEADLLIGGFADRYAAGWNDAELRWFEALLEEQDVDVMGWAFGTIAAPEPSTARCSMPSRSSIMSPSQCAEPPPPCGRATRAAAR